jgi:hypothetical protein
MRKHMTFDIETGETKIEDIPAHLGGLEGRELLEQLVHDCPECRAARARGERPLIVEGSPPAKRDLLRNRRPRWRTFKRNVRR